MIKPNWDIFKAKFSENPQYNFEWFYYLLFCKEFNKEFGIFRYKNQAAIVEKKSRIGDFEGDLIIGKNHKGALETLVDRI